MSLRLQASSLHSVGVQQKLMRHTDIRTTMRYGDAFTSDMAEAHGKVADSSLQMHHKWGGDVP